MAAFQSLIFLHKWVSQWANQVPEWESKKENYHRRNFQVDRRWQKRFNLRPSFREIQTKEENLAAENKIFLPRTRWSQNLFHLSVHFFLLWCLKRWFVVVADEPTFEPLGSLFIFGQVAAQHRGSIPTHIQPPWVRISTLSSILRNTKCSSEMRTSPNQTPKIFGHFYPNPWPSPRQTSWSKIHVIQWFELSF